MTDAIPHTPARLMDDLRALGLQEGQIVMLHASVRAVGTVMGGANTILQSILDTLTPAGTLTMYVGWEDIPDDTHTLPEDVRALYLAHHPPFDPATSRAVRDHSILAEFLRTWPGAQRSTNPEASFVAVGQQAKWLTQDHPLNYGYGDGSPLAKLVQAGGKVLLLGSPLDTITLLHHAEFRARLRHKHIIHYSCPLLRDGQTVWVDIEDYDTGEVHDNYSFEEIARAYLSSGGGKQGRVGSANSVLLDAAELVSFAVEWLEARFGA